MYSLFPLRSQNGESACSRRALFTLSGRERLARDSFKFVVQ